jgi:hypothetical protein
VVKRKGAKRMSNKKISIEASRKALLKDLRTKCKGEIIEKKIPFTNEDVPKYLKMLKELEGQSKLTNIRVC